jgi:hypothetical protein
MVLGSMQKASKAIFNRLNVRKTTDDLRAALLKTLQILPDDVTFSKDGANRELTNQPKPGYCCLKWIAGSSFRIEIREIGSGWHLGAEFASPSVPVHEEGQSFGGWGGLGW